MTSTPNGYDPRWIEAINAALSDREAEDRIVDIDDSIWERFIGPMIDAIEDGDVDETVYRQNQTAISSPGREDSAE